MDEPRPPAWLTRRWPWWPLVAGSIAATLVGTVVFWLAGPRPILVAVAIVVSGLALARWAMLEVRADAQGLFVRNWISSRLLPWHEIDHFELHWRASISVRPFAIARVVAVTELAERIPLRATTTVHPWASERSVPRDAGGDVGPFEALRYHAAQLDASARMAAAPPGRCWSCDADVSSGHGFCPQCGKNVLAHQPSWPRSP